jgi:predicted methyltransferase
MLDLVSAVTTKNKRAVHYYLQRYMHTNINFNTDRNTRDVIVRILFKQKQVYRIWNATESPLSIQTDVCMQPVSHIQFECVIIVSDIAVILFRIIGVNSLRFS